MPAGSVRCTIGYIVEVGDIDNPEEIKKAQERILILFRNVGINEVRESCEVIPDKAPYDPFWEIVSEGFEEGSSE